MTDEKYVFFTDSKEKKRVARGAYNKRSHAGRGGRMKMPSDYLTRKEREAMNGECISYRLNEPMKWAEFKEMPDDLKVSYINAIRIRFGPSDSEIFRMFSVDQRMGSYEFKRLNLGRGRGAKKLQFFSDDWEKWLAGIKESSDADADGNIYNAQCIMDEEPEISVERIAEPIIDKLPTTKNRIYPHRGQMALRGTVEEIAQAIVEMLGDKTISAELTWVVET